MGADDDMKKMLEDDARKDAQPPAAAPTPSQTDDPDPSVSHVEDEPRPIGDILLVDASTHLNGMQYFMHTVDALKLGWQLADAPGGGRSGQYVLVQESSPGRHAALTIPTLGPVFHKKQAVSRQPRPLARSSKTKCHFVRQNVGRKGLCKHPVSVGEG